MAVVEQTRADSVTSRIYEDDQLFNDLRRPSGPPKYVRRTQTSNEESGICPQGDMLPSEDSAPRTVVRT